MRPSAYLATFTLAILSASTYAGSPSSVSFTHHDWQLACDNTRTCRAAAYSSEQDEQAATVLFTRAAGPGKPVRAQLQLGHYEEANTPLPGELQMRIDQRQLGTVRLDRTSSIGELSAAQTTALLDAARKDSEISWSGGGRRWQISTKGANATLLKMDEFQGRLDTPGALVKKGNKPETSVLAALPVPEFAVPNIASSDADPRLLPAQHKRMLLADLRRSVKDEDCDKFADIASGKNPLSVYRLSADKLLVSAECWQGAYNSGEAYWVINERPPFAPVVVVTDATEYGKGVIGSSQKTRGLGDCWGRREWTWDGKRFVPTAESSTGMCRLIAAGGAWDLPTLVTKVSRETSPAQPRK